MVTNYSIKLLYCTLTEATHKMTRSLNKTLQSNMSVDDDNRGVHQKRQITGKMNNLTEKGWADCHGYNQQYY